LEYWNTGILEYWNTGILEYWNTGILEYWNTLFPGLWHTSQPFCVPQTGGRRNDGMMPPSFHHSILPNFQKTRNNKQQTIN